MSGPTHLTPRELAAQKGCTHRCVHLAIGRGELAAEAITGASGRVIVYRIAADAAAAWTPRRVGNPGKGGRSRSPEKTPP